jgi:hypothetical protein
MEYLFKPRFLSFKPNLLFENGINQNEILFGSIHGCIHGWGITIRTMTPFCSHLDHDSTKWMFWDIKQRKGDMYVYAFNE